MALDPPPPPDPLPRLHLVSTSAAISAWRWRSDGGQVIVPHTLTPSSSPASSQTLHVLGIRGGRRRGSKVDQHIETIKLLVIQL